MLSVPEKLPHEHGDSCTFEKRLSGRLDAFWELWRCDLYLEQKFPSSSTLLHMFHSSFSAAGISIATGIWALCFGFRRDLFWKHPNLLWDLIILLFNGYQETFLWVNWPGREADHSPPCNAEVKDEWSYTPTVSRRLNFIYIYIYIYIHTHTHTHTDIFPLFLPLYVLSYWSLNDGTWLLRRLHT
jgi:hypothetical protein